MTVPDPLLLAALETDQCTTVPLAFAKITFVLHSFNKRIGYLLELINVLLPLACFYHCLMMPSNEERKASQELCNLSVGQLILL